MSEKPNLRVGFATLRRRRAIGEIFLAVSEDEHGGETILTYSGPQGELIPVVAKDKGDLQSLRERAKQAAREGLTVRIISFTQRKVRETFPGSTTGD